MTKTYEKKIPTYFGWFIVIAILPQVMGINGSIIDSLYKLVVIGIFTMLMIRKNDLEKVSKYFALYMFGSIIGTMGIIVINGTNINNELQSMVISLFLLYILYERVRYVSWVKTEDIYVFYKVIVYFMFVASLYNMVTHINILTHITSLTVYNAEGICSFFDNKNTYGVFLLFGTLAATVLKINLKQRRWSILAAVFVINEMMAMCRTAIILSVALIIISFVIDRDERIKGIVILTVLVGIVFVLVNQNESINNYIQNNLFGNTDSLETRNDYISNMMPLAREEYFWFGYGNSNAMKLSVQYAGNQYYHNTYLKNFISGGIIRVILQLSAILVSFSYGFRCRTYNQQVGNLCIVSTVVYVVYAYVESVVLFDSPVVAIMASMFIISMPILFYNSIIYSKEFQSK